MARAHYRMQRVDASLHLQTFRETQMLSPHEFATLMLISSSPEQIDMKREELDTLLEHQLVALEQLTSGEQRPRLTPDGDSILRTVARKH